MSAREDFERMSEMFENRSQDIYNIKDLCQEVYDELCSRYKIKGKIVTGMVIYLEITQFAREPICLSIDFPMDILISNLDIIKDLDKRHDLIEYCAERMSWRIEEYWLDIIRKKKYRRE